MGSNDITKLNIGTEEGENMQGVTRERDQVADTLDIPTRPPKL